MIEVSSTGFLECENAAHVWGGEPQAFLVKDACMLPNPQCIWCSVAPNECKCGVTTSTFSLNTNNFDLVGIGVSKYRTPVSSINI